MPPRIAIALVGRSGATESLVPFATAVNQGWDGTALRDVVPPLSTIPIGWTMSEPAENSLPGCA
jgi:hypothetical protein